MRLVTLYKSNGEAGAFLAYPNLYTPSGEWMGFVTREREVYSVLGQYVGYLSDDRRILRQRGLSTPGPRRDPPPRAPKINPPPLVALAPLMPILMHSTMDVLLEEPERLHTLDMGELRSDLD
jgi:hypothetical protein